MKKLFKNLISKLVRLIFGKDYIISKSITDSPIVEKPKSKKEIYFETLAENRGRIIELMNRTDQSIDQDLVKLAIAEDLKISAIKYNDWKRVYNKIKGFNDPSDELRRLIAQDNLGDRIRLEQKNKELELVNPPLLVAKKDMNADKEVSSKLLEMLKGVKTDYPKEVSLSEIVLMSEKKLKEKSKVMDRILSSKDNIIK